MQKPFEYAEKLAQLQLIVAALAVLALLLTISLDVILRATVNAPFSATIEIVSFYYMIPIVFSRLCFLKCLMDISKLTYFSDYSRNE